MTVYVVYAYSRFEACEVLSIWDMRSAAEDEVKRLTKDPHYSDYRVAKVETNVPDGVEQAFD